MSLRLFSSLAAMGRPRKPREPADMPPPQLGCPCGRHAFVHSLRMYYEVTQTGHVPVKERAVPMACREALR